MPRLRADISGKRLRELMEAALVVFCRQGFERSQVADVAKVMGVAVGTVYLYVESKEALFDLVVRHTSIDDPSWLDAIEIPVRTPEPGSTVEFLRSVFGRRGQWPRLEAALKLLQSDDPRAELEAVVREQYQLMMRHRMGLLLLMRSTLEFPGLSEVFVLGLRKKLLSHFVRYIDSRVAAGQFRKPKDSFGCAAVLTSVIAWANLQRPFDPGFTGLDEETTQEAAVEFIVSSLLPTD
jgi:AcrR family transcriptional regulator